MYNYYHVIDQRYFQILQKSIQKERFEWRVKEKWEKREEREEREKSSTGSLTDMADNVFAESLKSPECIEIPFNCLRNVERQTKNIYMLAHSTQDHQIKAEKQLLIWQNP